MLILIASLLLLHVLAAHGQTSSSSSSTVAAATLASSSSASVSSSAFSPSSSSFYAGNEPSYPGCYLCPAITQCPPFPNTTIYPAFSIVATTSAAADAASCGAITSDILVEVTQYATSNSCVEAIGYLACFGSLSQQLDCHQPVSPVWPALCENYTACLEPAGQAFIQQAGLCTNITAFLNRPVGIQPGSSSTSTSAVLSSSSSGSGSNAAASAPSSGVIVNTAAGSTVTVVASSSGSGGGASNTIGNGAPDALHVSAALIVLAVTLLCALMQ